LNRSHLHTGRRRRHWRDSDHAGADEGKASGGMGRSACCTTIIPPDVMHLTATGTLPEIQIKTAKKLSV
jgi:hypothetical protein